MARLSKLAFHPVTLLLASVCACHFLLPFTDYVTQGDRWLMNWVTLKHFDYVNTIYSQTGRSFTGYYFGLFSHLPNLVGTLKLVGFLLCAATGLLVYAIAVRTRYATRLEALFLAVVAVTFPADKLIGGLMYSKSQACTCGFLLGVLLMLCAERRSGWRHWLFRLTALLPFLLSFLLEPLLVFYGGFLLLLLALCQRQQGLPWYRIPWGYWLRRPDVLCLPIVYWMLLNLDRPHGPYYNTWHRISFIFFEYGFFDRILSSYQSLGPVAFAPYVVISSFSASCLVALVAPVLLTAFVTMAAVRHIPRQEEAAGEGAGAAERVDTGRWFGLLAFGLMLFFLGTIVFAACGCNCVPWGDDRTRYACLAPLPLGVILVALGRAVLGRGDSRLRSGLSYAAGLGFAVLLVAWGVTWWDNYLSLEAVQIRDDAVFSKLHASAEVRDCSFYCVLNQYPIQRTIDDLNTWEWTYEETGRSREPRSIAWMAFPGCRPLTEKEARDYLWISTIPYALTTVDPAGKEGLVVIRKGPDNRFPLSVLNYLCLKHFRPGSVGAFLEGAVAVEFVPAPWGKVANERLAQAHH